MAKVAEAKVGAVFGRLTVVELYRKTVGASKGAALFARCVCSCEAQTEKHVAFGDLGTRQVSCGCLKVERVTTHGGVGSPEYGVWKTLLQRCFNPKNRCYAFYKDKAPPDAWKSFEGFLADVGRMPAPGLTLDRKDNTKGYSKENCRWATRAEQVVNREMTNWVNDGAESLCITHAALREGVGIGTVRTRLRAGKPLSVALGPKWSWGKHASD